MKKYFFVKKDKEFVKVRIDEILYLEACSNYVKIMTTRESYLAYTTFGRMEKLIAGNSFCRIHRSYIVSLNHVDSFDGKYVYIQQAPIPIGYSYRQVFKENIIILEKEEDQRAVTLKHAKEYVIQEN